MAGVKNPSESFDPKTLDVPEVMIRKPSASSTSKGGSPKETDSLLGSKVGPPPRYSSIEGSPTLYSVPIDGNFPGVHNPGFTDHQFPTNAGLNLPQTPSPFGMPQQQGPNFNFGPAAQTLSPAWYGQIPGPMSYYPPGLEHLNGLEEVTITCNASRYRVWEDESERNQIFTAKVVHQGCCGEDRTEALIRVFNNANLDVLSITRGRNEDEGGCWGRKTEHVEIAFPMGNLIGVAQGGKSEYTIHNPSGDLLFILERKRGRCCSASGYEIASPDRYNQGRISMEKKCCGSIRSYHMYFPAALDIRSKALLLSAGLSAIDLHKL